MRWKKANRNKRRALARSRRRFVVPFHHVLKQMFKPSFFEVAAWHEWLNKVVADYSQNLIHEDSIAARLMRKPEPTPTWRTQLPRLPPFRGVRFNAEEMRERMKAPPVFDDIDDFDYATSRYFKVVPDPPQPTKIFIYGDRWVAYRLNQ